MTTTANLSNERQPTRWWLPDKDPNEDSVAGLYWVSSNGTPCASWHSLLPGGPRSLFSKNNPIEILHGEAMGKAVTLTDVRIVSTQWPARGRVSHTEANATLAFEGDLFLRPEDLQFDRVRVRLHGLSSWADWTSWRDVDADRPVAPRLEHQGERRREFSCGDDVLAVEDAASWGQNHGEWTLTDGCRLDLTLDGQMPLHDLDYHWLRSVQLLIATATGRESHIRSLTVSQRQWLKARDENAAAIAGRSPWLQVRARQVQSDSTDEPLSKIHLLHRLEDMLDDKQMDHFINASRHHRYALERYENAKSGKAGSLETWFTEAAQAVESLDSGLHTDAPEDWQAEAVSIVTKALEAQGYNSKQRRAAVRGIRTAHEKPLSARLRRVDAAAGSLVSQVTASTTWAQDIQTLRNAVTHGRTGAAFKETGGALIIGREICLVLFELAWLSVMGHDQETAERLFRRRPFLQSNLDRIAEHITALTDSADSLRKT